MVLAADRKLYRDPYAPCTQDWKPIRAQRRPLGWDGETRHDGDQDKETRRGRRRWSPRARKRGEGKPETSRDHGGAGAHGSTWAQTLRPAFCHRTLSSALAMQSGSGVCPQPRGSMLAEWQALQPPFALGLSGMSVTHRSPKLLRGPATLTSLASVRAHLKYSQSWVGDGRLHPPTDGRGINGTSCCFTAPNSDKQQPPPGEPNSTRNREHHHP